MQVAAGDRHRLRLGDLARGDHLGERGRGGGPRVVHAEPVELFGADVSSIGNASEPKSPSPGCISNQRFSTSLNWFGYIRKLPVADESSQTFFIIAMKIAC